MAFTEESSTAGAAPAEDPPAPPDAGGDESESDFKLALLVGGTSALGRCLAAKLLRQGWKVRIFDQKPSLKLDKEEKTLTKAVVDGRARFIEGDVQLSHDVIEATRGAYAVFHINAPDPSLGPGALHDAHVVGTKVVLEACGVCGVSKLVFASSADVVFDGEEDLVGVDEATAVPPPKGLGVEMAALAKAEELVLKSDGKGGMRTLVLRPAGLFGPGLLLPALVRRARAGAAGRVRIGDGANLVDFTCLENAAEAAVCAERELIPGPRKDLRAKGLKAEDDPGGKAYFITNEDPRPYYEFVGEALEKLGYPRPTRALPAGPTYSVAKAYASVAQAVAPVVTLPVEFTPAAVRAVSLTRTFDGARARRLLKYRPVASLAEGLEAAVAASPELRAENTPPPPDTMTSPLGKEVKAALGGGGAADLLLWRSVKASGGALAGSLLLLSHLRDRTLASLACAALFVAVLLSLAAARAPALVARCLPSSPLARPRPLPPAPQLRAGDLAALLAAAVRAGNGAADRWYGVATGRHGGVELAKLIAVLYVAARVFAQTTAVSAATYLVLSAFTCPRLYVAYGEDLHGSAERLAVWAKAKAEEAKKKYIKPPGGGKQSPPAGAASAGARSSPGGSAKVKRDK